VPKNSDWGSYASFAGYLLEGDLDMSPIRKNEISWMACTGRMLLAGMLAVCPLANVSAAGPQSVPDVTSMSLEDLMNMQVTSVSKRSQKVADAAAAVFVITQEDIRRSGATSIPDALRMVPGLEVAQIDQNKWAIGSRGFNGRFDNKLLVLIDGRSVYTPLFSGVYWNVQDVVLEDVDRIEVIRGPGATLWGANAVDGVINIITKSAKATQGGLVSAGAGSQEATAETVRYGSKVKDNTYYRVYGKYYDWYPSIDPTGTTASDGWHALRGGFRLDSNATTRDSITVQGDIYHDNFGETLTVPSLTSPTLWSTYPNNGSESGGDLLGRWNHSFSRSSTSLQMYYDRTNIADPTVFGDHESVYDIDFQHDIHLGESQELVWGLGYRSIQDTNGSSFTVALRPDHSSLNQYSAFVQDEVNLLDNHMHITVGSKFEHNPFTGFEFEPNVRVLGTLTNKQSVWAAVSRAVRTPALTEEGLQLNVGIVPPGTAPFNSPLPLVEAIFGSPQFGSEDLLAYEVGYRVQATNSFSLDIAAFYNNYTNLRSAEPGAPILVGSPVPSYVVLPFVASNKMSGGTYGIEPFAEWKILPRWKLMGSYSFLRMNIHKNANSLDPTPDLPNGASPRHQYYFRSSLDLPKHFEQDLMLRYVDKLPSLNMPSYYSLDLHIGWKPISQIQLSFGAQNLLNSQHLEFIPEFINTLPTQVRRTYFGSIAWTF
jgi:iron complex outermembrane receptor protein